MKIEIGAEPGRFRDKSSCINGFLKGEKSSNNVNNDLSIYV